MNVTMRAAQSGDLHDILDLERHTPEAPHWQPVSYTPFFEKNIGGPVHRILYAAYADKQFVAFAAATLLLDGEENCCELESMVVDESFRRNGIGNALMRAVLEWAATLGARSLRLEVRAGNDRAIRFYRSLGLSSMGTRPGYYRDPPEDGLLMGQSLAETPATGKKFRGKNH